MGAITMGTAMIIGSLAGAGATAYGIHQQGKAASRAARAQREAADDELAFMREQAQLDRDHAAEMSAGGGGGGAGLALARDQFEWQKNVYRQRRKDAAPYRKYGVRQLRALAALTDATGGQ